jgi:hypothetical protein
MAGALTSPTLRLQRGEISIRAFELSLESPRALASQDDQWISEGGQEDLKGTLGRQRLTPASYANGGRLVQLENPSPRLRLINVTYTYNIIARDFIGSVVMPPGGAVRNDVFKQHRRCRAIRPNTGFLIREVIWIWSIEYATDNPPRAVYGVRDTI